MSEQGEGKDLTEEGRRIVDELSKPEEGQGERKPDYEAVFNTFGFRCPHCKSILSVVVHIHGFPS